MSDENDQMVMIEAYGPGSVITAFMSDDVVAIASTSTLRQAAAALVEAGVGCLVVGSADAVVGVVTERDVLRAVAGGVDLVTTLVAAAESTDLKWATPDSTVGEVIDEMMTNYVRHILVGEDRRLVGIVSMRDLLGAYVG